MANQRVKPYSLYYRKKRVATMQGVQYRIKTGDTQEVADSGAYNTDGKVTVEISCDALVPVTGVGVSVVEDAIRHNNVEITLGVVDGKLHTLDDARCQEIEFVTETATGKMTGKFQWFAGEPKITG